MSTDTPAPSSASPLKLTTTTGLSVEIVKTSKLMARDAVGRAWSIRFGHELGGGVFRHSCRTKMEARGLQLDPESARRLAEAAPS